MRNVILILFIVSLSCFANEDMVFVEGDTYTMGNNIESYSQEHSVQVDSFYISRYEITISEWKDYLSDTDGSFLWDNYMFYSKAGLYSIEELTDDLPMFYIKWTEAIQYCNWKSLTNDLEPAYSIDNGKITWNQDANGYRLPTEAEWEFAARGGIYSENFQFSGSNDFHDVGWLKDNSDWLLRAVGLTRPNELGLYDFTGNVAEWCWDYFDINYFMNSDFDNPIGPEIGNFPIILEGQIEDDSDVRVIRGGSIYSGSEVTIFSRTGDKPDREHLYGIRLVRNAD